MHPSPPPAFLPSLPVGFRRLHPVPFVNYQLNRFVALGQADPDVLVKATRGLRRFADLADALDGCATRASQEGALGPAFGYARGAEFFTDARTPERRLRYTRARACFDALHADTPLTRTALSYGGGALPVYRMAPSAPSAGVVLVHGGFDSLIEEFFPIWGRIAAAGFEVYAFEGPGQGGARTLHGLPFDHDWERPVAAVLDHAGASRASLVGISMGGYWALRAAAFEPRIERVVSWPPVYDWLHQIPRFARRLLGVLLRFRALMNLGIAIRMRLFPVLEHAVRHAMYLCDGEEPMDAVDWMLGMNAAHLHSDRVSQDVLLLVGESDAFQPPRLAALQADALTGARRVQARTFTRAEHADSHCQMGNLGLATEVVVHWLHTGEVLA
jgi:pimeloyl-ACP methyl ester carboxylesterase